MGRPSSYTPEIGAIICERLAEGEGLKAICEDKAMPCREAVRKWKNDNPEFACMYARAREDQADTLAADIIDISDNATAETVQQARLRSDNRKWYAAKLRPRVYGDKTILEGGDEDHPIRVLTDLELARRVARRLMKGDKASSTS